MAVYVIPIESSLAPEFYTPPNGGEIPAYITSNAVAFSIIERPVIPLGSTDGVSILRFALASRIYALTFHYRFTGHFGMRSRMGQHPIDPT